MKMQNFLSSKLKNYVYPVELCINWLIYFFFLSSDSGPPIFSFLLFSILVCSNFLVLVSKCGCSSFRRAKVERTTTSTVELRYVAAIVLSNTAGKWTVYGGVTVTLEPSRARGGETKIELDAR